MKNLFWVIAILLLLAWVIAYFVYGVLFGGAIHLLLVLAIIILIWRSGSNRQPPPHK